MLATIGYERAELEDFIATLRVAGVDVLVDIRDRAQSRRSGFSKTALSLALADTGIGYVHLRELGDPKEGREAARRGDYDAFREIYRGVLRTAEAKIALAQVQELARTNSICLMCFERDENTCHRKIVSDRLQKSLDCETRHLGVSKGAAKQTSNRRMCNSDQGSTTSIQPVF